MKTVACLLVLFTVSTAAYADEPSGFGGEASCRVAKPILEPNETVKWNGPCKDGYASGTGVLQRYRQGGVFDTAGARYDVTMVQGRISGEGSVKYPNGDTYTGSFKDGQRDGKGHAAYANGDQFEGDYRNDRPDGNGIFLARDRSQYQGAWKDGKFDGDGAMTFALGGHYEGAWKAGKFDGKGVLTYAGSGRRIEGEFEDGRVRGSPAPTRLPKKFYPLRSDGALRGSNITANLVTGAVPLDKSYAEFTSAQQATVKEPYLALEEGDEPPYPVHGVKPIYDWLKQAQDKLHVNGELRLDVLVGKDGTAISVTTIGAPSPEMVKFATAVMAKEKYKPAVCRGVPCEMIFPFAMEFVPH
jgi:hypothetical protein